jgi:acyl-CoA thioesterase
MPEAAPTSLQIVQELSQRERTRHQWGIEVLDAGDGWARISMVITENMLNTMGSAHGGMIFSLADTAFAYACNSRNVRSFAFHASITFLNLARVGERLIAHAEERTLVGRSGVYQVSIRGEDGRDIATFEGVSRTAGGASLDPEILEE